MGRPRIKITLIDQKGTRPCHHGHKIGDAWDFDTCPDVDTLNIFELKVVDAAD